MTHWVCHGETWPAGTNCDLRFEIIFTLIYIFNLLHIATLVTIINANHIVCTGAQKILLFIIKLLIFQYICNLSFAETKDSLVELLLIFVCCKPAISSPSQQRVEH